MKTLAIAFLLFALPASAQVVISPTGVTFTHTATDFAVTASYREEFFQCGSLTGGVCTGRAAAPFQTGTLIPKAAVTGTAPTRNFLFSSIPVGSPLPSLPAGVPFVTTLVAIGDPNVGGVGESGRSSDSSPFFAQGRTPAAPTNVAVQ